MIDHTCDQGDVLGEIRADIRVMKVEQKNVYDGIDRLCKATEENMREARQLTISVQEVIGDSREFRTRIGTVERDVQFAFDEIRRVSTEEVAPLRKKIDEIGAIKTQLAVNNIILTGVKLIASAVALALVGIGIAAVYGRAPL